MFPWGDPLLISLTLVKLGILGILYGLPEEDRCDELLDTLVALGRRECPRVLRVVTGVSKGTGEGKASSSVFALRLTLLLSGVFSGERLVSKLALASLLFKVLVILEISACLSSRSTWSGCVWLLLGFIRCIRTLHYY